MSVNYKAIYGIGYHITEDMISEMDEDKFREFIESDFTYLVNRWSNKINYFYGLIIASADEGKIINIPYIDYKNEDLMKLLDFYYYLFPTTEYISPSFFVINQAN